MVIYTAYFKSFAIRKVMGSFGLINPFATFITVGNSMLRTFKLKPFLGPRGFILAHSLIQKIERYLPQH
jgi:hypothetical protein